MKSSFTKYLKDSKNRNFLGIGGVTLNEKIGEGGNGLVFAAEAEGYTFAFKFLLSDAIVDSYINKTKRFVSEHFNIALLDDKIGIVKCIDYDPIKITAAGQSHLIPVIIMKIYSHSLKVLE